MRVLVTGGAGYIGSILTQKLIGQNHEIIVYDKMLFDDNLARQHRDGCREVVADLMNEEALRACLPCDACCHLAAVSNDPSAELDKGTTDAINVGGTLAVANLCAANNIPMIAASTASVYGFAEWELCTEESALNPQSHYGRSKVEMEERLRMLQADYPDWQLLIFRKATVFGWSPRMRYDLVVNTMVRDAFTNGRIRVVGGGECWRPLVAVRDVANAYITALNIIRSGKPFPAPIINLVHKNYRIGELAAWIAWCLREEAQISLEIDHEKAKDTRSYATSDALAKSVGINCPTGIKEAVDEIWFKLRNGVTADIDNPRYYNHAWLSLARDVKQRIDQGRWLSIP